MKVLALCLLLAVAVYGSDRPAIRLPLSQTLGQHARIVNGTDADISQFPFQCSLRFVSSQSHTCGCSIIASRYVMTANHCVVSGQLYIVVGTSSLSSGGTRYEVEQVIQHENYDPNNHWQNDISLLRTTQDIAFGGNVAAASLPSSDVVGGDLVTITGWGTLYYNGPLPDHLQKIENWPIVDLNECRAVTGIPTLIDGHLCAGARSGQGICNGDSGGPLSRGGTVYGIDSFIFIPCGSGYPDVFTRVYYYIGWIQQHMGAAASELKFA